MKKIVFDVVSEPVDETYRQLLARCAIYSTTAMVVVRRPSDLTPAPRAFLEKLEPWIISKEAKSEWPGTILEGFAADIYTFRLDSDVVSVLQSTANGLYQWEQPDLPEDLCFFRPDGSPILVTISHERDSYLNLTETEAEALVVSIPRLKLVRHSA